MSTCQHRFTAKERRLLGLGNTNSGRRGLLDTEGIGPRRADGARLDNPGTGTRPAPQATPAPAPDEQPQESGKFPAVLVLAAWDGDLGRAVVFQDRQILRSDEELQERLATYRKLEEEGADYEVTVARIAAAETVVAEQRAALEEKHSHPPEPASYLAYLDEAYTTARRAFAGDPPALRRLQRGYQLAREGLVWDKGNGKWMVQSDYYGTWTVTNTCTCPDDVEWCKHRLAVALVVKAQKIEAGRATNTPASLAP